MTRKIIIGDVHGCSYELNKLLDKVSPTENDHLFFLGDLINRGPDSHGVIRTVRKLDNCRSLLGNHELRILKFLNDFDHTALKGYDIKTLAQLTKKDKRFIWSMEAPIFLDDENTILVHAGFMPGTPWNKQGLEITTEVKAVNSTDLNKPTNNGSDGKPWYELWKESINVVYGHWPKKEIVETPNTVGIDTACVYGGFLTAYFLPEKKFVQVQAKKNYV
jgi:serine/threonine protein phosphatase 1